MTESSDSDFGARADWAWRQSGDDAEGRIGIAVESPRFESTQTVRPSVGAVEGTPGRNKGIDN